MRLYLIRHAEAAPGEPDELRPLTPAGRAHARELGRQLHGAEARVDAVLCSPLLRARETADAIASALQLVAEPVAELAPGAGNADVLGAIEGRGGCVVVVGHQPDCSHIAATLGGGPEPPFPPGGMARIDL